MANKSKGAEITRRAFFRRLGLAGAAAGLASCGGGRAGADAPGGAMTCRTDPKTGRGVSLLGYGCMRWPFRTEPAEDGNPVDQEAVNRLVDYAIAHGVNYFDTAPVYSQGWSEKVTGAALKRHPRERYFIATKMSADADLSRENMTAMYSRSLADLQVDYIDYYLLHAI